MKNPLRPGMALNCLRDLFPGTIAFFYAWPLVFIACIFPGISSCTSSGDQAGNPDRPNIIVILSDDIGYSDIGCYGSEIRTPNIDRLAAEGIRYTHFYNTARCSPSRAALLTGRYPHQAAMGHLSSSLPYEEPGYRDDLSHDAVTIAEVLREAGYSTYMTGKWHLAREMTAGGDTTNWPLQRGFDRYFGTLNGSGSYYDPGTLISNNTFVAPGRNFYYTDAISDTTVKFITEHPVDKPFFFYIAYTAAHWPLHAPEDEIAKYRGVYDEGWDSLRIRRFRKQKELGVISEICRLSERSDDIPAWEDETMKEWQTRRMEVYAAMIDVMDQGIGRILAALENKGISDNTVILYMHDNGGCAEPQGTNKPAVPLTAEQQVLKPFPYDSILAVRRSEYTRDGRYVRSGRGVMAGDADTWVAYGAEWANASNTPFRLYKQWVHEGGIASPLIIRMPAQVGSGGRLIGQPSHLIDIMPTCLEMAGVSFPETLNGKKTQPVEGVSLIPSLNGHNINRDFIFWEHSGNRAIRMGKWKLVSKVRKQMVFSDDDEDAWELYNIEEDPAETKDLAARHPGRVKRMAGKWEKEAIRTQAKPWPWDNNIK